MSIRNNAFLVKGLLACALVLFALPALATTVTGPEWILASENGGFYAEVTVFGGEGGDFIDTITMTGMDNCDETKVNEYDCQLFVDHGEMVYRGINSRVITSGVNAMVTMTVLLCDGREFTIYTEVRPYGTVANDEVSFDSIKALYR